MINLKLVFRSRKACCHGNKFCVAWRRVGWRWAFSYDNGCCCCCCSSYCCSCLPSLFLPLLFLLMFRSVTFDICQRLQTSWPISIIFHRKSTVSQSLQRRTYPTSGPVSTEMGDRVRAGILSHVCNQPTRSTQSIITTLSPCSGNVRWMIETATLSCFSFVTVSHV